MSSPVLRGVRYAFGRGLDPRQKDGVRAHPTVFIAGMVLHVGIAAAGLCVATAVLGVWPPAGLRLLLIALTALGALGGLLLFARRLREPVLQAISVADDYVSNLLVVTALISAAAFLLAPQLKAVLLVVAAALVIYAPFGKIRHCVLFFVTRARFGAFIGTRGVLVNRPPR